MAVLDVVVGRQPVFDVGLNVVGYELLFRPIEGGDSASGGLDGDHMTSMVLFSTMSIGIDHLVGDKQVFCNADRGLIVGQEPIPLPPERTIIEIHESLSGDPEVLEGCRRLYEDGFLIAVDDYTGAPGSEAMLELASMVKIDLQLTTGDEFPALVAASRGFGVLLAAERIETKEQLEQCRAFGFNYYQGYLLSRPGLVPGKALAVYRRERIEAAAALLADGGSAEDLERITRAEPALAYQLLQIAGVGIDQESRRGVRTLREALVKVGARQLQSAIGLLLATTGGQTSHDEVVTTLARARMCELVASQRDPGLGEFAFAAGLISAFDGLTGTPLEELLVSLPLDPDLRDAAAGLDSAIGRIVHDVTEYQLARPERVGRSGTPKSVLDSTSAAALAWALEASEDGIGRAR